MSCEDFKGSAHAFREFMRREQDAIERGERMGASVKWATADPRQTMIGWLRGALIEKVGSIFEIAAIGDRCLRDRDR